MWKILIIIGTTLAGVFAVSRRAISATNTGGAFMTGINNKDIPGTPFEALFREFGGRYGVDWRLLSAIAFVESSYNPAAINYQDNESIGLMQILCRPDGSGGCSNTLPAISDFAGIKKANLLIASANINIGAQLLKWNIDQFGLSKAIAVYNAWDQRNAPDNGPFKNQSYVNKVLSKARELGYE